MITIIILLTMIITSTGQQTQNLTALFHEALTKDGSLQSSVGVKGQLADLELVYLHRHPTPPPTPAHPSLPTLVVNIPSKRYPPASPLVYSFTAFNRRFSLKLVPTTHLVSPTAHLLEVGSPQPSLPTPITPTLCHYTHVDGDITAALSACRPGTLAGYLVSRNTTLEVRPLEGAAAEAVHQAFKRGGVRLEARGMPHLVRRVPNTPPPPRPQPSNTPPPRPQPPNTPPPRPQPPNTPPARPQPSNMDVDIPPPACKEPIGNAVPDDMEFDQGEILTIPPQAWQTSLVTEAALTLTHTPPTAGPPMAAHAPPTTGPPMAAHTPPTTGPLMGTSPHLFTGSPEVMKRYIDTITPPPSSSPRPNFPSQLDQRRRKRSLSKTIELGVFVDQAAYDLFYPYLGSRDDLTQFILCYVNGIQALFHHPSLGHKIRLVINYVELMVKQPARLVHFGGDREKLYDSFRMYNLERIKSTANMVDIKPWDIGILISGHNFYTVKAGSGDPSYSTMGLAAVRGVCVPEYSAVIVELGVTDTWGKPYPTAGFASVYVMAHEIGHNLGMLHDGYGNSCPKNGYIMSASRSTSGETNWSSCSREVLEKNSAPCLNEVTEESHRHDHTKFEQLPGQTWDAYDQCRIFLRDEEATLYNETLDQSVCASVMCRSPNRIGYFKAGPALDGTFCGNKSWCIAGVCTRWRMDTAPSVVAGGWGDWHHNQCTSGCLFNARGVEVSQRTCSNPKPKNTIERCQGVSTLLHTCDDQEVCKGRRMAVTEYADKKCNEFSTVVTDLQPIGAQAPHNPGRQWQACAIFCKRASGTWYSPRTDLSYLPHFDTYFPDGTPCHEETGKQFYCQRHQCLPLGEREAKFLQNPDPEWDVHVYQNAPPQPSNNTVPVQVTKIFELTKNMAPLQSEPLDLYHVENEALWEDDDYLHV
nr:A disintegrin and metalloproteinase with thrombospondin motifs 18-like [Cherax quadricarinatus]